ncbi:hypothetical protein B0H66DRAFT_369067 [Apodospora peruviana]|uniref:Uncharacterized protein n=1 Tax=Apodospora peruviana TaxID=516989 RepID=A0AAE0LZT5_9PEZI|nr:hypothetical protein B0H66DRAFT_369067 [Apodospora peruviana]
MTSRFCRWKPCGEVQSFGGKFCTKHTCGGGLDGDCTNKIAFEGAERCIHHKCSVVDCIATKLDYSDVNYCLAHFQGSGGAGFSSNNTQEIPLNPELPPSTPDEELAVVDPKSTALVLYNNGQRDSSYKFDSPCRNASCNQRATGQSPYCRLHKCWRPSCNAERGFEAKMQKWSQGCGNHTCRYKGCLSLREKGSDYCAGHLQPCKVYNCPRRAHNNGPWCNYRACLIIKRLLLPSSTGSSAD